MYIVEDELVNPPKSVEIGYPSDTKKAQLYKTERAIVRKIKDTYNHKSLTLEVESELFKVNNLETLNEILGMSPKDTVIKLIGEKKFGEFIKN